MKLTSITPEDQQRLTKLADNIRSMEESATQAQDPVLAAMIHYLGAALLDTTLKLAKLTKRFDEIEESFEAYLEAQDP